MTHSVEGSGARAVSEAVRVARWVAVLLCIGLAGCWGTPGDAGRAGPPNVLLISIDTLRADRLGVYGHHLPTSPRMDRLARRGVRFRDATVPWPRTWPAMASMLTGTYPSTNGVRFRPRRALPTENETLAEALRSAGYATGAVVANVNLGRDFAFDQGFEHFVESWQEAAQGRAQSAKDKSLPGWVKQYTNATIVTDAGIDLLDRLAVREPFFLWLHYMDTHGPYLPPDRYASLWTDEYESQVVPMHRIPRYQWQFDEEGKPIADLAHYEAQYDREIRYLDDEIGRLLDDLERRALTDETLVVLTADHGESLREHREYLRHGGSPYQPEARVPLAFVLPGRIAAGRVVDAPVALLDLKPTVLELIGVPSNAVAQGQSLVSTIDGAGAPAEYIFLESGWDDETQLVARRGRWKLVQLRTPRDRRRFRRTEFELYDLEADPGETTDVSGGHPAVVAELRAALAQWVRNTPRYGGESEEAALDEDTRKMLRALGYADAH